MDYPGTLFHGLPPLPRAFQASRSHNNNGYNSGMTTSSPIPQQQQQQQMHPFQQQQQQSPNAAMRSQSELKYFRRVSPAPPVPPRGPGHRHSRHSHSGSSSSNSSAFMGLGHSSPDHHYSVNRTIQQHTSDMKGPSSSPARSLSSSPHTDSGLGRSSADSFSSSNNEPRAFVRVVKSPHHLITPTLDSQLTQLKKDMQQLRQMDMALLGHLLSIHQGIQDLRNVLVPPPPPGPAPSSSSSMYHRQLSGHEMNYPIHAEKPRGRKSASRRERVDEDEQSDSLSSIEFGDV